MAWYVYFISGLLVGLVISSILKVANTCGVLKIDTTGERDIWQFCFDGTFDDISNKHSIVIKVDNKAHLSQDSQLL